MRYKLLLAFAALLVMVPFASFLAEDSDGAVAPRYDITGYVADTRGEPITDVELEIIVTGNGETYFGTYNPSNGFFLVNVGATTNLIIKFKAHGYTAISCPNSPKQQDGFALTLTKAAYSVTTRTYTITSSIADGNYVIMRASTGEVAGHISYGAGPVKNATVTLTPTTDGSVYTTSTDENGNYWIPSCPTGTYNLTVSRQGFNPYTQTELVNVTDGATTTRNITMEKSEQERHFGMDTAHLLMLIGVVVGILMAVAAWLVSKRMNGPNRVEIFDDSTEDEEDLRS